MMATIFALLFLVALVAQTLYYRGEFKSLGIQTRILEAERAKDLAQWEKTEDRLIEVVDRLSTDLDNLNAGYHQFIERHLRVVQDKDILIARLNDDLAGRGPEHLPTYLLGGEPNESWSIAEHEMEEHLSRQPDRTVEEMAQLVNARLSGEVLPETTVFEEFEVAD